MSEEPLPPPPAAAIDREQARAIADQLKADLNTEPKGVNVFKVIVVSAIIGILAATSVLGYRLLTRSEVTACDPSKRPSTPTTIGQIYVCNGEGNWVLV